MADEYLEVANGDARIADTLRRIVTNLADSGTGALQEIARDIVNGGSLRAVFFSSVYAEELEAPFRNFWSSYQDMSGEERAHLQMQAREYLRSQE